MVQINFALKEVNCKIVYYGPGMSGKTTNLEVIHKKAPKDRRGELTSIATEGDRTLFFDFMPLDLGKVGGMNTKFQLYTVPGQVYYNATRKLVLQGADGVVFVADAQQGKLAENLESLENLRENLSEYGMDIRTIPLVIQYNKMDLPNVMDVAFMEEKINIYKVPSFPAVAIKGKNVFPTLKKLTSIVLESLNRQHRSGRLPTLGSRQKPRSSVRVPAMIHPTPPPQAAPPSPQPPVPPQATPPQPPVAPPPAATPAAPPQQTPTPPPPAPLPQAAPPSPPPAPPQPSVPTQTPPPAATPPPQPPKPSPQKAAPQKPKAPKKKPPSQPAVVRPVPPPKQKSNTLMIVLTTILILFFLIVIAAVIYVTGLINIILG